MTTYTCSPNGVLDVITCINTWSTTNGVPLFSTGIVLMIWLILYFKNKDVEGARNALVTSSFFASIIGIILGVLGLLPDVELGIMIVIAIASVIPVVNRSS